MVDYIAVLVGSVRGFFSWIFRSISDFFNSVLDFLDWGISFLGNGIYEWLAWGYAGLIEWLTLWSIQLKVVSLRFAWSVARQIASDMGLGEHIAAAWSFLPPDIAGYLSVARIPEVISILVTAYVTRFVLRFIPSF